MKGVTRQMRFEGNVLKTSAKWNPAKDNVPAERIMQITIEVAGSMVDIVAQDLLKFGPEESLNIEIEPRQVDYVRVNEKQNKGFRKTKHV